MRRLLTSASLAATIFSMLAAATVASNWPRWRGPEANGVAPPGEYPLEWSATEHVAWKYSLPERSSSTPIVWDGSIFLTSTDDGTNVLICLGPDGKERWKASLGKASEGKNRQYGSGSGPSPVTDGRHIYAYFKSGDLASVDFAGNVVWRKNLQEEYGKDTLWWDLGTSPVLTRNAVVVAVMQTGPSFIVALDKQSGSELWKQDRTFKVPEEADNSYTTPIVHQQGGKEILLVAGADHATAHDAQTGKEIWRVGGLNPRNEGFFRSIASPVLANEVFVVPYSRGDTLTGIKIDGSGDVTKTHTLWSIKNPSGVDVPTPASENGRVYLVSERGLAFCVDAASGDVIWSKHIPCRPNFRASPVVTADRIYCLHENGTTYVLSKPKQNEEPEVLATNELDEFTVASPVFFDGKILIRTYDNLYCIQ